MFTEAAIKIINIHLLDENEKQHYLDEARNTARLDHPNIVRVLECGIEKDIPFLVLAYAPHGTLRVRHPQGTQVPLRNIVPYTKQVAAGLQYAHDRRLIHRDVKPANMLLGPNNEIWLSDFGIAIMAQTVPYGGNPSPPDVMGTVGYMAPEQFDGKPAAASDQYALGVVVYEWLCGSLPFNGTPSNIAVQQLTVSLSLRDKVPDLSPAVEQVVLRALQPNLKDRFPNVQTFAEALEQAYQDSLQVPPQIDSTVRGKPIESPGPKPMESPVAPNAGVNGVVDTLVGMRNVVPPPRLKETNSPPNIPNAPGEANPKPVGGNNPPVSPAPQPANQAQQQLPPWWANIPAPNNPSPFHDSKTVKAEPSSPQPSPAGAGLRLPPPVTPPFPTDSRSAGGGTHLPPPVTPPFPFDSQSVGGGLRLPPPVTPPFPFDSQQDTQTTKRRKIFDRNFYKYPKNRFFLYGGIIIDICIAVLLFLWAHNSNDPMWSQNDGNLLLLSFVALLIVRGFCASARVRNLARPFAWILALSWGVAAYALINIMHWGQNWAALILVLIFVGWVFQDFLYLNTKPKSTKVGYNKAIS